MATQKNIQIIIDSEPEKIFFNGDPEKIEIIFNNLISNAVKYNRDKGKVHCTLREYPDSIAIIITDTGIGMSEEDIPKLFQEFVRLKNDKTRKISGSGLGLSITRKIIEEFYNGKISVTSVPDEGTTFTIELPKGNLQE
jgi:signal transduction histidine kinase